MLLEFRRGLFRSCAARDKIPTAFTSSYANAIYMNKSTVKTLAERVCDSTGDVESMDIKDAYIIPYFSNAYSIACMDVYCRGAKNVETVWLDEWRTGITDIHKIYDTDTVFLHASIEEYSECAQNNSIHPEVHIMTRSRFNGRKEIGRAHV